MASREVLPVFGWHRYFRTMRPVNQNHVRRYISKKSARWRFRFDVRQLQCSVEGEICYLRLPCLQVCRSFVEHCSDFTSVYNPILGNCYIFNSGWNESEPLRVSSRSGKQHGMYPTVLSLFSLCLSQFYLVINGINWQQHRVARSREWVDRCHQSCACATFTSISTKLNVDGPLTAVSRVEHKAGG